MTSSEISQTPLSPRPIAVLLVDDQLFIAEALRRMLQDQTDIAWHYCANGADALSWALEIRPDVILQDLVLPGVDGIELLKQYRAHELTRGIPVILLSSSDNAVTRVLAAEAGANEFMVKPPPKATLISRIRALAAGDSAGS